MRTTWDNPNWHYEDFMRIQDPQSSDAFKSMYLGEWEKPHESHSQERLDELKLLLKRYLGDDSPHDISNMASNISKLFK